MSLQDIDFREVFRYIKYYFVNNKIKSPLYQRDTQIRIEDTGSFIVINVIANKIYTFRWDVLKSSLCESVSVVDSDKVF